MAVKSINNLWLLTWSQNVGYASVVTLPYTQTQICL